MRWFLRKPITHPSTDQPSPTVPIIQRTTQKLLARLAGVSHTTVSLALRGHPRISETTRSHILKLAETHGYRPDSTLSALNAYRLGNQTAHYRGNLVWLTNFPTPDGWRAYKQMEGYFLGAVEQAKRLGYSLEEFWIGDIDLSPARLSHILFSRGVSGLLIAPQQAPNASIHLNWTEFSAVTFGYSLARPQLHMVMNHQFRNMQRVVRELRVKGYRRIGIAMPASYDERADHNYLSGFWIETRASSSGPAIGVEPLLADSFDFHYFIEWFNSQQPDAIVTATNWAPTLEEWLDKLKQRVPEDIALAVPSIPFRNDRYTGVDENVRLIGSIAVDTLVGMIHRNEKGVPQHPLRILVEGCWHEGETVKPNAKNFSL